MIKRKRKPQYKLVHTTTKQYPKWAQRRELGFKQNIQHKAGDAFHKGPFTKAEAQQMMRSFKNQKLKAVLMRKKR